MRVKVVENRGQGRDKLGRFTKKLGLFRDVYLEKLAEAAIQASVVDTGTYITSHNINPSGEAPTTSSAGKPRRQDYQTFADIGYQNLLNDIAALPEDGTQVLMANGAEHADVVEDRYHVYSIVKKKAKVLLEEAKKSVL